VRDILYHISSGSEFIIPVDNVVDKTSGFRRSYRLAKTRMLASEAQMIARRSACGVKERGKAIGNGEKFLWIRGFLSGNPINLWKYTITEPHEH
jgi:hypothetical protein